MNRVRTATRRLTMLAMMLAMVTALSALEHMLPPLPLLPPNVRLGFSNIVTMYTLFFLGARPAFSLAALKALFVLIMRGFTAGLLSLCGGVLSLLCILGLAAVFCSRASYLMLSIAGAIAHNAGQMLAASVLLGSDLVLYYLPVLVLGGVVMGAVTGTLLRVVLPLFQRVLRPAASSGGEEGPA